MVQPRHASGCRHECTDSCNAYLSAALELSTSCITCRVIFGLHDLGIVTRAPACLATHSHAYVAVSSAGMLILFAAHTCCVSCNAGDTKLAGASAGSLIAACYHSGLPEDLITKACFTLAKGAAA
jgi:hypothetical protein